MGAPEVLIGLFLLGVPLALGWCAWALTHRTYTYRDFYDHHDEDS